LLDIYRDFGFTDVIIKFADRPPRRVGADDVWDRAEAALQRAMQALGLEYTLNKGEGAFYGPKIEFVLRDAIGRDWQCGTLQVDLNLPGRLGATYIGEDGNRHTPVLLHRAISGSLERFFGILLEHSAGALPFWLAPTQVLVATITSDADEYARQVAQRFAAAGLRADVDLRNEKINYKVREHSLAKIPAIVAVGKREVAEGTVALRRLGQQTQSVLPLAQAVDELRAESAARGRIAAEAAA
jgi:threonyl-tRNA synthetase